MRSFPKNPRLENPHLLLMARREERPCLLSVPGLCTAGYSLVACCACHGNGHEFNKGRNLKAHDFFSVWGCARCHNWLDSSYIASGQERHERFLFALARQIEQWAMIANGATRKPKDREAAEWALTHLIERGYAAFHPEKFAIPIPHASV